jgi:hypothetical protein
MKSTYFISLTTPGHKMKLATWLAELAVVRSHPNITLPPRFWTDTRWKWKYGNEIKAINKHIKKYGEKLLLKAFVRSRLTTFTSYGDLEVLLQQQVEIDERINLPKDNSPCEEDKKQQLEDLRDKRATQTKGGLFAKLRELES